MQGHHGKVFCMGHTGIVESCARRAIMLAEDLHSHLNTANLSPPVASQLGAKN